MGDATAKYSGRLSINPLAHFDLVGFLCMLFFHFGWAKPVPINPDNFKNRKKGIIYVSLAGPVSNLAMAIISAILLGIVGKFTGLGALLKTREMLMGLDVLVVMLYYCIILNIGFMIFNLIPIPPLDGSKVLMEFLPGRIKYRIYQYERYSFLILILIIYSGILDPILSFLSGLILNPIFKLVTII
ncbi:MAG: site-2 protease family protein [Ruminococcaceae bacterium]|nr:site-2 protease family protein [Oscillospiraceae bacterium]